MHFELHVDGTIEVMPLPSDEISYETIKLLARMHTASAQWHHLKRSDPNLVDAAISYFRGKGFEINDKGDENTIPAQVT